jgi:hypothetical protein
VASHSTASTVQGQCSACMHAGCAEGIPGSQAGDGSSSASTKRSGRTACSSSTATNSTPNGNAAGVLPVDHGREAQQESDISESGTSSPAGSREDKGDHKHAPDLPLELPCRPQGGFRHGMGVDISRRKDLLPQNKTERLQTGTGHAADPALLRIDFECNSTQRPPSRRNLLEDADTYLVCCYEGGQWRPPDADCSQGRLSCSAWGFGEAGQPHVQCTAASHGPIAVGTPSIHLSLWYACGEESTRSLDSLLLHVCAAILVSSATCACKHATIQQQAFV